MKIRKILFSLFSTLASVSAAYASPQPQMFVGVQGGLVNTNFNLSLMQAVTPINGSTQLTSASIKNHVWGVRVYGGYQWNQYLAGELGYFRPRSTRFTQIQIGANTVPTGYVSEYAIDIRGKVFLPMAAYINLSPYFALGAAYVNATSHGGITRNAANDFGYSLHPVLAAGIGYNFTPNLTGDISWATITKRNSSVPRMDMFFAGITYHFSFAETKTGAPNYGDPNNDDP